MNAKSQTESQAGVRLGAAFDRVTVHALLGRGFDERWSPTVTAHVRALGSPTQGYALGLLGQDKTEGLLPRPQRARWRRARRRRGRRARRGGQARTGAFGLLTIGAASSL